MGLEFEKVARERAAGDRLVFDLMAQLCNMLQPFSTDAIARVLSAAALLYGVERQVMAKLQAASGR